MLQELLSGLNPEQLQAVTAENESILVLAGAGSGKTRVLTTRIAWLIQSGRARPGEILAVTFTNKAAREMMTRVSSMLPVNTSGMWVGTFHGLCNRLLRTHHRAADLPQLFQILDSQDQLAAVKRVCKANNVDEERYPPRQLQYFINDAKEQGLRAAAVETQDDVERRFADLYALYDAQCQREGVVDFAELLLRTYELLQRDESLREHYRERFRFILVDEFQDTNRLQYRWLRMLAGPHCVMCAVGDDDQSIYAFRGADIGNMREFERDFAVRRVVRLEQNYRSYGNILEAANALISHNRNRLGKNLWSDAGHGEPIRVYEGASDGEEAAFIIGEVAMLKADGVPLSQVALLYRSNAQSRVLEHALFSAGLPYRVYGGLRFFERQEVKHALAYLRLAANTDDDGAFLRVVNFPTRGIGTRSIEQLEERARAEGVSLYRAATASGLSGRAQSALNGFIHIIAGLADSAATLTLPELVAEILTRSGLAAHYRAERDGSERLENLEELVNAAGAFQAEADDTGLASFLSHASLEAGEHEAGPGTDALQLMTVHAAKGLEFHSVFVSGLEEGLFPHDNSRNDEFGLEEERRLMYVAITRARQRLYLSYAQSRMLHGQVRYGVRSRFLGEVPEGLCKWVGQAVRREMFDTRSTPSFDYGRSRSTVPAHMQKPVESPAGHAFSIGQNVTHAKFGSGVIISCKGYGGDAQVQVNFRSAGTKWLALQYANLQPA